MFLLPWSRNLLFDIASFKSKTFSMWVFHIQFCRKWIHYVARKLPIQLKKELHKRITKIISSRWDFASISLQGEYMYRKWDNTEGPSFYCVQSIHPRKDRTSSGVLTETGSSCLGCIEAFTKPNNRGRYDCK